MNWMGRQRVSEGAGAAEWMAFLSPFSEASLNRCAAGQLGLGTASGAVWKCPARAWRVDGCKVGDLG